MTDLGQRELGVYPLHYLGYWIIMHQPSGFQEWNILRMRNPYVVKLHHSVLLID